MQVERQHTFLGLENNFPPELRASVIELIRRVEDEIDSLVSFLQVPENTMFDVARVATDIDGSLIYEAYPDGTLFLVEEPP